MCVCVCPPRVRDACALLPEPRAHTTTHTHGRTRALPRIAPVAQAGLFEALLTSEDAVISDELNHASIIDGIRLCKAKRFRRVVGRRGF